MSTKYTGGFITKSPVAPTSSAASGIWTLDQQQQAQKAGIWPSPPMFIEDLFSCFLYTGNGSTQTINNGIDLSGKGGLVWLKGRSSGNHILQDTDRGANNYLMTDSNAATQTLPNTNFVFGSSGFSMNNSYLGFNANTNPYASWTFRKQPKFFDVVTYTGNGVARTIAHNLGSVPGCIIVKTLSDLDNWAVYHRSLANNQWMSINTTEAVKTATSVWNNTAPTESVFSVGTAGVTNGAGVTYVAYLFAHDAGGFPVSGTGSTNGISCGSFTTVSSAATVNLGYEPQWILWKRTDSAQNWNVYDNMRGLAQTKVAQLYPNLSQAEDMYAATSTSFPAFPYLIPTATGFQLFSAFGLTGSYIYIAIRRGPMKTPTNATTVFSPQTATYTANQVVTTGFVADLVIQAGSNAVTSRIVQDRIRGVDTNFNSSDPTSVALFTNATDAERGDVGLTNLYTNTNYRVSGGFSGFPSVNWNFSRAPGFFDIVCYTGTGVARTVAHNLTVAPELMIVKVRDSATNWAVYSAALGNNYYTILNLSDASYISAVAWNSTTPTSSVFSVGTDIITNGNGYLYVAYLFATLAGVSKVGSYTGDNSDGRIIDCGFTTGARFILIRRTDQAGHWAVWDSARGITSGNDPYLMLNNTNAQVTGFNDVGTTSTGFTINATSPGIPVNVAGSTYIFLAIA